MKTPIRSTTLAVIAATLAAWPIAAQQTPPPATGEFVGADGQKMGEVTLTQGLSGVLVQVSLVGVPQGVNGLHIHEIGVCEPPFDSAGGHFNPSDVAHGYFVETGPHAGDLPNVHVPASGEVDVEMFSTLITLEPGGPISLLDADGAALVLHAGADDYRTDPSGHSGGRIACAVLTQ